MAKVADLVSCPKSKSDYCLNGGSCYVTASGNEETLCSCTLPYYGARCDRIVTDSMEFKKLRRQFLDRTLTVAGIVITFIVLFLILVISWYISWRRRKDLQNWKQAKRQSQRYKTVQVNLLPDPTVQIRQLQETTAGPSYTRPSPRMVSIGVNTCFQEDLPNSRHLVNTDALLTSREDAHTITPHTQYSRYNSYPPPLPPGLPGHQRVASMPGVSLVAPDSPSVFSGMSPSKTSLQPNQQQCSPYSAVRYQPASILRNHHHHPPTHPHHSSMTGNHLSHSSPSRPPNLISTHSYQPHSNWLDGGLDDSYYSTMNHHDHPYYQPHSQTQQVISPLLHRHQSLQHHQDTHQSQYRNHPASLRVASEHDALLNELIDRGYTPSNHFSLSRNQESDVAYQRSFSSYSGRSGIY